MQLIFSEDFAMEITKSNIEKIFNTLPISYYLKRNIAVTLEDGEKSFFDPVKDVIVIGAKCIIDAFAKIDDSMAKSISIETVTRSLFYHEISHVILTPRNLFNYADIKYKDILNVFEDERIETILKNFYMDVDFKKSVVLINNYKGELPKNASEVFYQVVRYRVGKLEWVNKVTAIINRYKDINARYNNHPGSTDKDRNKNSKESAIITHYVNEIIDLYKDITKEYPENAMKNNSQKGISDNNDNDDNSNEDSNGTNVNEDSEINVCIRTINVEDICKDVVSDIVDIDNTINNAINDVTEVYHDDKLINKLNDVIDRKQKKRGKAGSAINSYHGKMIIKNVATRDDYLWWSIQNREGNIRRFSKVHFNLFIDRSGSFYENDTKMNIFLRSLEAINNKDFSFDVITINDTICEWPHTHLEFKSRGGNAIPDSLGNIIKKHTPRNTYVYNIVLFDGDCHTNDSFKKSKDNLCYFDTPNTIIVSDNSNKRYFSVCISKAKIIYTKEYCAEFINSIVTLLNRVM